MFAHPVVEVPAVGLVDRAPVLEPLRDHEAAVEDRHREHDQREEQRDHGVRLQGAQDGHRGEQVAEQVGARIPHEAGSGRESVPQEAQRGARGGRRQHPRPGAVERQGDDRERGRRDHANPCREPVDAVDEVDHVHHGDEAEHGQDLAQLDVAEQDDVMEQHLVELHAAQERQGEVVHPDAVEDRDHRGDELPQELRAGGQVEDVVEHSHGGDHRGAAQDRPGHGRPGQEQGPGDEHSAEDRQTAQLWRRRLVQAALSRLVHGVQAPRRFLGQGHQQPGDEHGHSEGEQAIDRVGSSVNEHRGRSGGEGIPRPRGLRRDRRRGLHVTVPRMRSTSSDGSRRVA